MASRFWKRSTVAGGSEVERANEPATTSDSDESVLHDGSLAFTRVVGGNNAKATYQEAVGAPVERRSPLGYHVGWITVIFLNVNQMIGTGIFSTRMYDLTSAVVVVCMSLAPCVPLLLPSLYLPLRAHRI
jgi:hypothetical protein